jgi:hypothetical protein
MSKREKIILVLMALTVIYGFYALFIEGPPRRGGSSIASTAESKLDTFNKFIASVAAMTKEGLSDIDSYIIEHIPTKWTKDPLLNTKTDFKFDEASAVLAATSTEQLDLVYSGFLQMGSKSLAIINGMEYESGEVLPQSDYVVGRILPNRVVILMRGGKQRVSIPIEETP